MRRPLDSWAFPDSGAQVTLINPGLVKAMGGEGLVKKASLQIKDAGDHIIRCNFCGDFTERQSDRISVEDTPDGLYLCKCRGRGLEP